MTTTPPLDNVTTLVSTHYSVTYPRSNLFLAIGVAFGICGMQSVRY
ncbi:hypothetical protein M8C21_027870, partial [Ambrosia artemisiifolia]